jgi:anti-anti-sigma factor
MGAAQAGLEVVIQEDHTVLRPWGDLDVAGAQELAKFEPKGTLHYLMDMQRVSFLDGSGVQEILRLCQQIRDRGGRMSVVNSQPQVDRLLLLTGCKRFLDQSA